MYGMDVCVSVSVCVLGLCGSSSASKVQVNLIEAYI